MAEVPDFLPTAEVLDAARRARPLGLCPECFGRLFGRLGHGLTNPERASRILAALGEGPAEPVRPCPGCGDAFARLDLWIDRAQGARPDSSGIASPAGRAGSPNRWRRRSTGG